MQMTWYGHSTFSVEMAGAKILIDPFFEGNPSWGKGWEGPSEGCTHVVLTHGHDDHIGNAVEICKQTGAMLVANFELCMYLKGKGIPQAQINPGNYGGTLDCNGFTVTFVQALHSSSSQTIDGQNIYLGNPAGVVFHAPDEKTLYHMGDTDIFSDMALIDELHQPQIGIVPIGDRFTMGGAVAALACRRYFQFETVIPCHYGSFPILDADASTFEAGLEGAKSKAKVATIGEAFTL